MSVFSVVGRAQALAHLAVAKATGIQITLSHRNATAVTLWALVVGENVGKIGQGGMIIEERVLDLSIPAVQTGFAVTTDETEPLTPGDVVTYLGRKYSVCDPIDKKSAGYIYLPHCLEKKPLAVGVP